jgi:long-chain fatty acid transport protein
MGALMSIRGMKAFLLVCGSVGALVTATAAANAGGFGVREQSVYGQGSSFAGIAAGGDLSGMFWNPAVMTQFAGVQSSSTYSGIIPYTAHTPTAGTWLALGGTSNTSFSAFVPSFYFSYQLNQNLWLGMSVNSPFGLATHFPSVWAGRDYATNDNTLTTYNASPSIAYRVNDWISIGAGVQIEYAKAELNHGITGVIPVPPFIVAVGNADLSANGWGYGFTAGVTLTPTPTTTVGLGYRSGINQKLSGTLILPPLVGPTVPAETTLNLPDIVSLGVRQRMSPQLTLLGTVEWTNWSRIGTSVVSASPLPPQPALTLPFQYQDGWFFSVGGEYQASDRLALRAGVGYEISPVTDRVRNVVPADADRIWASIGASYQIWRGFTANLAYSHLWVRDSTINISAASGNPWFATTGGVTYIGNVDAHADILSIGMKYRWDSEPAPAPASKLITK